jgi:hypothetical protein
MPVQETSLDRRIRRNLSTMTFKPELAPSFAAVSSDVLARSFVEMGGGSSEEVGRLRRGRESSEDDNDPYRELYLRFAPPSGRLVRILMRMGCEREEACDLAQEALVRLSRQFEQLPNPEAWVTLTATNLFRDRFRHLEVAEARHQMIAASQNGQVATTL